MLNWIMKAFEELFPDRKSTTVVKPKRKTKKRPIRVGRKRRG